MNEEIISKIKKVCMISGMSMFVIGYILGSIATYFIFIK